MVLDISLIRTDEGLQIVQDSQKKRFADSNIVDDLVEYDKEWIKCAFDRSRYSKLENMIKRIIGNRIKANKIIKDNNENIQNNNIITIDDTILQMILSINIDQLETMNDLQLREINNICSKMKELCLNEEKKISSKREEQIKRIGNIIHPSVPISSDEKDNEIICLVGDFVEKKYFHGDLLEKIDGIDCVAGSRVAGNRGYFLKGPCVYLAQALQQLSLRILDENNYVALQTPYFMNANMMADVAQLSQYDEELYKVINNDNDIKYLIATSEQPITLLHSNETISLKKLPIKYSGLSTCFRKEAGRQGKDMSGIFRVHQFEKIEQFIICSSENNESWNHLEDMLKTSRNLLDILKIPYRVVNIVSGDLNLAAAKKYDIEGWLPGSKSFRELVSCSNCTDYHSRNLRIKHTVKNGKNTSYVHMLNATMCAVTRMLCVICENYQTDNGIIVPDALQPFMPPKYNQLIPFVK